MPNSVSKASYSAPTSKVIMPYEVSQTYNIEKPKSINRSPFFLVVKRGFDIVVSFVALVVLFIPMLIIALCIMLSSDGPAFYIQDRLGKNGVPFKIIKFRTMYINSEKNGAQWSSGEDDERITSLGRFLRNSRIDELPQLIMVLTGKMSLVGPRPERECFYNEFEKYIHGFSNRMAVTPGLTGLAQINGGYNLKPEEKIIYDMEYINNQSLFLDIKIIFKTFSVIFTHEGAK